MPFRQFVLKVHSRCDLACDHCYVYRHADQSWRSKPTVISQDTVSRTAERIAEHVKRHQLNQVDIILHGGEPLLAGRTRLERISSTLNDALSDLCHVDLRMHTNGILLTEAFCDLFVTQQISVGISLDGDRRANDLHRRYADGRSSYDKVLRAIQLLRSGKYRHLYSGILCTIDLRNDPVSVYDALAALEPPRIDFLLPHATWENPPMRPGSGGAEYGEWLIAVYDRWKMTENSIEIRTFDSIIRTTYGETSLTEALGLGPSDVVVIDTDGSYEQADSLKTSYDGAPATGHNIYSDDLDVVGRHPGIVARQRGLVGLCNTCQRCSVVTSCGGGLYAHRYKNSNSFDNPSVYCADLMHLITHIRTATTQPANCSKASAVTHAIGTEEFDELANGYGSLNSINELITTQRSIQRSLLTALYNAVEASAAPGKLRSDLNLAWDLILEIEDRSSWALDISLSHPYFRVRAVQHLQELHKPGDGGRARTDITELTASFSSIALTAAIQSGMQARLEVPIVRGLLCFPSLGRFVIGHASSLPTAMVEVLGYNRFRVRAGSKQWMVDSGDQQYESDRWQLVRQLATPDMTVALEDTDPYRDCHEWPAAPRLSAKDVRGWANMLNDAWALIKKDYAGYAPALAVGLKTLTPLLTVGTERLISSAARHAFGAVAAGLPTDSTSLALLLLHEFQHVKLGALLDMYDLFDKTETRLFHAPWRTDPRPLEALFQGAYAHLLVTDFWRVRSKLVGVEVGSEAAGKFVHWYLRTRTAIETLATSGAFTELGERFLAGMRATIESWRDEPALENYRNHY